MKKLLLFGILMLLPMLVFAYDFSYNGLRYSFVSLTDQTVEIASSNQSAGSDGASAYSGDIVIPSSVSYDGKEYTVIGIGQSAFVNCVSISSISLPNTLTYIGKEAFQLCLGLKKITIPKSVESYGYDVFSVTSISEITVLNPNPVKVPYNAFYYPQTCNNCVLYVPYGTSDSYRNTAEWNKFSSIIELEKEPDLIGGHEYVDLGLPSGDCWATCYVGASTPEEYGGLYAWGETETKDVYTDETYLYTPIYIEGKDSIDPEGYTHHTDGYYVYSGLGNDIAGTQYDVANVKWGHGWKIPTCEQAKELILNCTFEYVEKNGVKGFKVTGPNKKSIFFTAGPHGYGENIQSGDVNSFSCWTSTFNPNEKMWGRDWKGSAYHFWANYINDKSYNSTYYPSAGFTIRPVITKEAIEDYKMNTFTITYIVDEEFYKSYKIKGGETIPPEPAPTKEGYTFSGWSEIPETMPAHDVTITGVFTKNPPMEKCATPTIAFKDGKLVFDCETEGVTYVYSFTAASANMVEGNNVSLTSTYTVTIYAKKDGYLNSDIVTKEIDVRGLMGDMNEDGVISVTDVTILIDMILNQ